MQVSATAPRRVFGKRGVPPRIVRNRAERLVHLREASANPDVAADKFDRLLGLEEQITLQERQVAFDTAFTKLQLELPAISERGTLLWPDGRVKHTYALWEDVNEAIRPHLCRHGFALMFTVAQDATTVSVTCRLRHIAGHGLETTMRLPVDLSDGKNAVQAIGSSTSYGKRYSATSLLNITTLGDDDDGAAAGREPRISAEQLDELRQLAARFGAHEQRLGRLFGVTSLEMLPARRFAAALAAVRAKGDRK
jgi:hypothetical protein